MNEYLVGKWIERTCWCCGHYESDSPSYREHPELFENMVHERPKYFLEKYLKLRRSDDFTQGKESNEDYTEPKTTTLNFPICTRHFSLSYNAYSLSYRKYNLPISINIS